jgi:predicted Ser/Thr protein kinase
MPKKPEDCKENEVYNKITKRCVSREGRVGKKILKDEANKKSSKKKSRERKSPERKSREEKKCPEGKVYNKKSHRCVNKDGKVGKEVLRRLKEESERKPKSPPKSKSPPKKKSPPKPKSPVKKSHPKPKSPPKKKSPPKPKSPVKKSPPKPKSPVKKSPPKPKSPVKKSPPKPKSPPKKSPPKPKSPPKKSSPNPEKQIKKLLRNQNVNVDKYPFKIIKKISEGVFGEVFEVEYKGKTGVIKIAKVDKKNELFQVNNVSELYCSLYLSGKKYFPKVEKVFYTRSSNKRLLITPYYIMYEYIRGQTLDNFIKTLSTEEEFKKLRNKIVEILDWFCNNNMIHNDFHTSNIMVVKNGDDYDLKVLDFGYTFLKIKCSPHNELVKLISSLYISKAPKKLIDTFLELYNEKYVRSEDCIKGDVKFPLFNKKTTTTKELHKEMSKMDYNFFNNCYAFYFNRISKIYYGDLDYDNIKVYDIIYKYNYENKEQNLRADFTPYSSYFEKF